MRKPNIHHREIIIIFVMVMIITMMKTTMMLVDVIIMMMMMIYRERSNTMKVLNLKAMMIVIMIFTRNDEYVYIYNDDDNVAYDDG